MKWSTRILVFGLFSLGALAISTEPTRAQNPFEQFQKKVDEAMPKGRLLKKLRDDLSGKSKEDERKEKAQQENEREDNKRNANRREPTPAPRPNGYVPPANRQAIPTPATMPSRGPQNNSSLLNSNFVPPQIGGQSNPHAINPPASNNELPRPFQFSSGNESSGQQIAPNIDSGFGMQLEETNDGLTVAKITPGGNADRAGLKRGDQIVQLGGVEVQTQAEWNEIAQILSAGDQIQIEWSRRGEKIVQDLGFGSERSRDPLSNDSNTPSLTPPTSNGLDTREQIGDTAINDFLPPVVDSSRNSQSVLRAAPESNRELLSPNARQSVPASQQELEYLRQTVDQQNQMIKQLQQEVQRLRAQGANNQRNSRGR